jgi:hypothetical protein
MDAMPRGAAWLLSNIVFCRVWLSWLHGDELIESVI